MGDEKKKKILIVGGGILGLSLAYHLPAKGYDITIVEKQNKLGGLASSFDIADTQIEHFYHHIFKSDTHIVKLIEELGLKDKLEWLPSKVGMWDEKNMIDLSGSLDVLKFPLLNFFDRIRFAAVTFLLQKINSYKNFQNVGALTWSKKFYGKNVTRVIWEPLLKGKFGKFAEEISMSWLWSRIRDRSSSRPSLLGKEYLGYMKGSFGVLVDDLENHILTKGAKILTSHEIINYAKEGELHKVEIQNVDVSNTRRLDFDVVVSTVPGPVFNNIFPNVDAEIQNKIASTKYLGATCMLLTLKKSLSPYYWLNITNADLPFLAIIEHTNFVNSKIYNNKHLVYIAKYLETSDELYDKTKEELLDIYVPHLVNVNPEFSKEWIEDINLVKSEYAQHIVGVDYVIPPYNTGIDGLYYANFSQIFPHDRGMNYSVEQGKILSDIIVERS